MATHPDSLSVLVVDKTPQILVYLARLLRSNNIRALLARDSPDAIGIAERDYVPIDLVLINIVIPGLEAAKLVNRLREIRPGLRALYMSARLDCEAIRVELMPGGADAFTSVGGGPAEGGDLIESIRSASTTLRARGAGVTQDRVTWTIQ